MNETQTYPDIVYELQPCIHSINQFIRAIRWQDGYYGYSLVLISIWTLLLFHPLTMVALLPLLIVLYLNYKDTAKGIDKREVTSVAYQQITNELNQLHCELSRLVIPVESCKSLFIRTNHGAYIHGNHHIIIMYILWVGLLSIFGIRPIIWSIGVAIMTANSPLVNMLSYCYKRIALICRQNTHTKQVHPTAIPIDTQYDHFYRFHIVEHQRWWFHRGWCDTLLPSDRPLWSDEYLSSVPSIHEFQLPPSITHIKNGRPTLYAWNWSSPQWEINRDIDTDKEGWEYGRYDWSSWGVISSGLQILTRRRHWIRDCYQTQNEIKTESMDIPLSRTHSWTSDLISTSQSSYSDSSLSVYSSPISIHHRKASSTCGIHVNHHVKPLFSTSP